jgi:hypothetical protein
MAAYSQYHIDGVVFSPNEEPWRLTCVYGEARTSECHKTWDMLKFIKASSPLPWLCIGDFNEVLHREEHLGVNERSNSQIQAFREIVDVCGLMDLGYVGTAWTFENKVTGGTYSRVRLDRALATPGWSERFPMAELRHLTAVASDHSAIFLRHEPKEGQPIHARIFRYEAMWESHDKFAPLIEQVWNAETRTNMQGLERKLMSLSGSLTPWGRDILCHVRRELKELKSKLAELRVAPDRVGPSHRELKIVERLVDLQHREETMWQQCFCI